MLGAGTQCISSSWRDPRPLAHRRYDAGVEHPFPEAGAVTDGQILLAFLAGGLVLIGVMGYWASKKPPDIPEC